MRRAKLLVILHFFLAWTLRLTFAESENSFVKWANQNDVLKSQDQNRIHDNWSNDDWKSYDYNNLRDFYHKMAAEPLQTSCSIFKRVSGQFYNLCAFLDGEKLLCMDGFYDDVMNGTCLVYSFGLSDDWDFELAMAEMGCTVRAYDPFVDQPPKYVHPDIHFEKVGIGHDDGFMDIDEGIYVKSFSSILKHNGDTNKQITYLKLDVEGHEMKVISQMLKSGSLKNVRQFGLEIHLIKTKSKSTYRGFTKSLQQLRSKLGFDLVSYNTNNCVAKAFDPTRTYYSIHDLVFYRPSF